MENKEERREGKMKGRKTRWRAGGGRRAGREYGLKRKKLISKEGKMKGRRKEG